MTLNERIERRQPDSDRRQTDRRAQPAWVERMKDNAKDLTGTVAS